MFSPYKQKTPSSQRTKANFRGTTFIHRFDPVHSTPDHHQGCAVTGLPVPVYSEGLNLFFGNHRQ